MAIIGSFKDSTTSINDAYIKIARIWGSKQEGWNAWVGVYDSVNSVEHKAIFAINVVYEEDVNPFKSLYAKIASLPFIENVRNDVESIKNEPAVEVKHTVKEEIADTVSIKEEIIEQVKEEIQATPKKKGRAKKNSA